MALLTTYWLLDVVVIFLSVLVAAYLYMTRHFNYWKKRDVFELPPKPFVGNLGECCLLRMSVAKYLEFLYERGKGLPYVGFYIFDKPTLVLRDHEIIKSVLIKDFDSFVNRYSTTNDLDVVGSSNMFFLNDPLWRRLRSKLTSVFPTAKIKAMLSLFTAVGDDLAAHFASLDLEGDGRVIELKEISAKYTTDVLGSCIFGLHVNSLKNPDAEFRRYGKRIFESSFSRAVAMLSIFFLPGIVKPLRFTVFTTSTTEFLRRVFWDTLGDRLKSGLRRNDLIDLLIELKNNQIDNDDPNALKFEGDFLVAQAASYFVAGFETTATLMSFALHELSLNPDIQNKLRHEINSALGKNDGEISYEMVQELPYLNKVVWETLRKYPPLPYLDRVATSDYTIAKTGLVIEKGTPVYVSVLGLHYDPEYFPDPEKFDPERFCEVDKRKHQSCIYLPFGEGPRGCIGSRFGLMQAKLGIITIISKYEVMSCEETLVPMRIDPKTIVLTPHGGLYHRVRKIKTTPADRNGRQPNVNHTPALEQDSNA